MTDPWVYLNGRFVRSARARVSLFDRGLLYGDGLFETLRCYGGHPFALDRHRERLRASATYIGIDLPRLDWDALIRALMKRNHAGGDDSWVRLTITRGCGAPRLFPAPTCPPTFAMFSGRIGDHVSRAQQRGIRLATFNVTRGSIAEHKTLGYLTAYLGKRYAQQQGADDALFIARELIQEATTASFFLVLGERLLAPSRRGNLPGVTAAVVRQIAGRAGFTTHSQALHRRLLATAEEAFITSSVSEIVPVCRVDEQRIGNGRPGPVTRLLQRNFRQLTAQAAVAA